MKPQSIQAMIEKKAGITPTIARYMMLSGTVKAKTAMSLLKMAVDHYDEPTMTLLKEAVIDCQKDIDEGLYEE